MLAAARLGGRTKLSRGKRLLLRSLSRAFFDKINPRELDAAAPKSAGQAKVADDHILYADIGMSGERSERVHVLASANAARRLQ
jgi:hypothetical protein